MRVSVTVGFLVVLVGSAWAQTEPRGGTSPASTAPSGNAARASGKAATARPAAPQTAARPSPGQPGPGQATPAAPAAGAQATQPQAQVPPKRRPKSYLIRLREIAERIEQLKEQVSQTKYRLSLLKEAVLHGTIAGCALEVKLDHQMGSTFRLTSVRVALDGKPVFSRQDITSAKEARKRHWPIFSGPVPPGPHVLTVELRWRGYGHGVFNYLRGYRFRVLSSFSFQATEGTKTTIRVIAYEKGNRVTTPLKDRPAIKFKSRVQGLEQTGKGGR